MPTQPRRWSRRLEGQRAGADAAAQLASETLEYANDQLAEAQRLVKANPDLAARMIADARAAISEARTAQEHIRRLMLEARIGKEEE